MRRIAILAALTALACASAASTLFAAGWSLTADTPLSYTFDKANANQPPAGTGGHTAFWDHRSTDDVGGSKVLLIAPFHLGVGYEDYTVAQTVNIPGGCPPCTGKIKMNLQIVDAVIDFPMRFLNIGLGYGSGQANADLLVSTPTPIRHAGVSQTFVTLGIPLGAQLDIHAAYHWVSVEKKDFSANGGGANQVLLSGEMLSAGLRLNF